LRGDTDDRFAPVIHGPGRRAAIAVGLVMVLLLAACGSGGSDTEAGDAAGAEERGGADGFPVTIEHKYGSTEFERRPERIVTVGLTDHDALLALGVAPVGVSDWFGNQPHATWPWAVEALGDAKPEIVTPAESDGINFEAIAAQRPDAIIALYSDLNEADYGRLSELAPTVAPPEKYVDYGIPWQESTRIVGQVVGKSDRAEELIADVEQRFTEVREEHPEFEGASAIVATPYEGIFIYGVEDPRGRLLQSLGFELPKDLTDAAESEFGGNLSVEKAELLDVDAIIWLDPEDGDGPLGGPLYGGLPVHTEGREVFLDSFEDPVGAATSFVTVLSLPYLLDHLVPKLAAAVDGDPATVVEQ
jgi:iron complex transport system substrate-binding protein